MGKDVDAAMHFGIGAKFYAHRLVAVRLDLRDVVSARAGVQQGLTSSFEVLLGLSITLGRKPEPARPKPSAPVAAPAPEPEPAPVRVPVEVAKWNGVIEGIEFDYDSDVIRESSRTVLDEAAKVLAEHRNVYVRIVGHTDASGNWAYNVELSQRRANAVAAYLIAAGIDMDRLDTAGLGPAKPIADNATEQGRARNRRIEFELMLETAP